MRGYIEQVWENESRNGQKYLTVQINGEKYSVWDAKYFDQLQEGLEIEYEFRHSGNFKHLTDVRPVKGQESQDYKPSSREIQIARLSCLKSASEILAPVHMDIEDKEELVIELAKRFERYVFKDDPGVLSQQERSGQKRDKTAQNQD